jgi:hypothetical protein
MRNNVLRILAAWTLAILGSALIVLPFFIEPRRSPTSVSHKNAVNPDTAIPAEASPRTSLGPETLARSFIHPGQRTAPSGEAAGDAQPGTGPAQKMEAETAADWLRPLGKITDEAGIVRLYFKSSRDGRLIRVRQDGTEENGISLSGEKDDQYLITINGVRYIVPRRRK